MTPGTRMLVSIRVPLGRLASLVSSLDELAPGRAMPTWRGESRP